MPRKHSRRSMMGGFDFGSFTSSLTNSFNNTTASLTNSASSLGSQASALATSTANKVKNSMGSSSTPSYTATSYLPRVGGKKRRSGSKKMRGGNFTDNSPTSGLAFHAALFSGETARPNTIVGGKTRKRRKHHKRSKSHRRR